MERRKAITAAAAASLTLLAGAGGLFLTSGAARGTSTPTPTPIVATVASTPSTIYVDAPTAAATPQTTVRDHRTEEYGDDD